MAIDKKELYFAHSLDIAWILALWHFIHGGDSGPEGEVGDTTELLARALAGHLTGAKGAAPTDAIEKMAKLGMKVTMHPDGQRTEIKSTKEFYALSARQGMPIKACVTLADGVEFCWTGRFSPPWFVSAKAPN